MKLYLLIFVMSLIMQNEVEICDFDSASKLEWRIVNDGVMGGISQSRFKLNSDSTAVFYGNVRPDNNGGFASVRAKLNKEYGSFKGIIIRVKGDSKIYSLRFRTDNYFDGYSYQAKFKTKSNVWEEIKIPLNEIAPTFRGRTLYNKPELKSEDIKQVGILIADKQFENFILEIDWIKFY